MEQKVRRIIEEQALLPAGCTAAAAISGGADSVCLLHILRQIREALGISLEAVHVNHGIRASADRDEAFVRALCKEYEIPLTVVKLDVPDAMQGSGESLEEAARRLRYEAFAEIPADYIVLAHHQQDQAETVLLNLFRGSGLKGLGAMQMKNGRYIRPLLDFDPAEIRTYLSDHGLSWVEDETNQDVHYRRNYIRHVLLPQIRREINPQITEALARTAALLQADEKALAERTEAVFLDAMEAKGLQIPKLQAQPEAVVTRVLRRFLETQATLKNVEQVHIAALQRLMEQPSGRQIRLPGDITVIREFAHLRIRTEAAEPLYFPLPEPPWHGRIDRFGLDVRLFFVENVKFDSFSEKTYTKTFDYDTIKDTLTLRTRLPGDYLTIGTGHKKLKDYMIDAKIPLHLRDQIPLVADGSHILWVIGYRMSDACKISAATKRAIELQIHADLRK